MRIYEADINDIKVLPYLSFADKKVMVINVIAKAIDYSNGYARIDSLKKYMEFKLHIVEAYTEIEFSADIKERYIEYDDLCRRGMYDKVIEKIGEEADECRKLLDMAVYDIERDDSIQASVSKIVDALIGSLDDISAFINDKIKGIEIDSDTLMGLIGVLSKAN